MPLELSPQQLEKLPKKVQSFIKDLIIQRDVALRNLKKFEDSQTPSNISYYEYVFGPEGHRIATKYLQTDSLDIAEKFHIRINESLELRITGNHKAITVSPVTPNVIIVRERD